MAQVYRTWEQHLEDLTSPQARETSYDLSSPSTQPQTPAPVPQQQDQAQPEPPLTPAPGSYAAPSSGQIEVGTSYQPSSEIKGVYANLFQPVQKDLTSGWGDLGKAVSGFNSSAAPLTPWGDTQKSTLESALKAGPGTQDWTQAKGYLAGSYTAPTLDTGSIDSVAQRLKGTLGPQGAALDTSAGARDLLARSNPGLTRGEQRYEAPHVWSNPDYQAGAEGLQTDISKFWGDFLKTQGQAQAITETGGKNVADTKAKAADYLQGAASGLQTGWDTQVSQKNANIDSLNKLLAQAQATGQWQDLAKIPESARAGWKPEDFVTGDVRNYQQAQDTREKIMSKYADLDGVPTMVHGTNSKGKAAYVFPKEWFAANKDKYTTQQMADLKARARQRDLELAAAGFSPTKEQAPELSDYLDPSHWSGNLQDLPQIPVLSTGKYSDYLPEYFGQDWQPENPTNYLSWTGGAPMAPTAESVASDADIARFNAIESLLGNQNRVDRSLTYQDPTLQADVPGYQSNLSATLDAQKAAIQNAIATWQAAGGQPSDPMFPSWLNTDVTSGTPEAMNLPYSQEMAKYLQSRGVI